MIDSAPQLYAELVLDIIVIPVVLPELVAAGFGGSGGCTAEVRKVCL